jgi:hypothetical protein
MSTYSHQRPVKLTANSDDEKYLGEHLTYFFNTVSYRIVSSFSQVDKERFFKMVTDHEVMISKLYGEPVLNSLVFLPVALRKGAKDKLANEYKVWLEKQ